MPIQNQIFPRIMNIGAVQRQSLITLVWQILFTLIGFLSTMYFAHAAGANILGAYFLFMAYYGIVSMVTDGGFGGAAIKRISEGEEQNAYFSAFFALRLLFTIIIVIALIIFRGFFVDLTNSGLFIWLILILVLSIFQGAISTGVAGRGKMGISTTCAFIGNISRIIAQVVAIYLGFGAGGLAGGFVAGILLAAIIEFHFFDLHLVPFKWKHIKSLSVFSFWLFLTSGGVLVFSQADTILIGYFMNTSDIGIYRVALQFTMAATFTTYALRAVLWPRISRWGKTGEIELVEESLARAISYSLILAIPVFTGGILLSDKLLYFFYGEDFISGYKSLIILLLVQVVNVFQYLFTMYLDALDHPEESFKVTALAAIVNILLNIALIPIMGILGAAIATLVTMMLNALLARHILSGIINIRLEYRTLLNIVKASIAMGITVGAYRLFVDLSNVWVTIFGVVVGGIVYIFLILKFDKKICNELQEIIIKVGLPWPGWL